MNKIVVAIFNNEMGAAQALRTLAELHFDGQISVFGTTVFGKNSDGSISVKQMDSDHGLVTVGSALVGGLIGAFAGPAGVLAGMALGGLGGSLVDLEDAGIDARFADEVSAALAPGKVALLADIQEEWTAPVDEAITAAGGIIFRRNKADITDEQWLRDVTAFEAELEALEAESKTAAAEDKAKLQQHIDAVKKKIADTQSAWSQKLDKAKEDVEAKVKALQAQVKTANDARKDKINARIESLKADLNQRREKLQKSAELAKEALRR
jgi:hypothetical protein